MGGDQEEERSVIHLNCSEVYCVLLYCIVLQSPFVTFPISSPSHVSFVFFPPCFLPLRISAPFFIFYPSSPSHLRPITCFLHQVPPQAISLHPCRPLLCPARQPLRSPPNHLRVNTHYHLIHFTQSQRSLFIGDPRLI